MSEYKEVLFKWAAQHIDEGYIVTGVDFVHEEGYRYSTLTFQDPYDQIIVSYRQTGGEQEYTMTFDTDDVPPFGQLLKELFEIAEKE